MLRLRPSFYEKTYEVHSSLPANMRRGTNSIVGSRCPIVHWREQNTMAHERSLPERDTVPGNGTDGGRG